MDFSKEELQEIYEKPFIVSHIDKNEKKICIAEVEKGFITKENILIH